MPSMPDEHGLDGSGAREAAFALAFGNPRSPLPFETCTDAELLSRIRERAAAAQPGEYLKALALVRGLCSAVYEICEAFRDDRFGTGTDAASRAIDELSRKQPGFSKKEYEEAFAAGMLWTAF